MVAEKDDTVMVNNFAKKINAVNTIVMKISGILVYVNDEHLLKAPQPIVL